MFLIKTLASLFLIISPSLHAFDEDEVTTANLEETGCRIKKRIAVVGTGVSIVTTAWSINDEKLDCPKFEALTFYSDDVKFRSSEKSETHSIGHYISNIKFSDKNKSKIRALNAFFTFASTYFTKSKSYTEMFVATPKDGIVYKLLQEHFGFKLEPKSEILSIIGDYVIQPPLGHILMRASMDTIRKSLK